jgi:hypothetical protein
MDLSESLRLYYGLDYVAGVTAIMGMYALGSRSRAGFWFYTASSVAMLGVAVLAASPPIFITNVINIVVTLRGLWRWSDPRGGRGP